MNGRIDTLNGIISKKNVIKPCFLCDILCILFFLVLGYPLEHPIKEGKWVS